MMCGGKSDGLTVGMCSKPAGDERYDRWNMLNVCRLRSQGAPDPELLRAGMGWPRGVAMEV